MSELDHTTVLAVASRIRKAIREADVPLTDASVSLDLTSDSGEHVTARMYGVPPFVTIEVTFAGNETRSYQGWV